MRGWLPMPLLQGLSLFLEDLRRLACPRLMAGRPQREHLLTEEEVEFRRMLWLRLGE